MNSYDIIFITDILISLFGIFYIFFIAGRNYEELKYRRFNDEERL
jgi:hypothetical protein